MPTFSELQTFCSVRTPVNATKIAILQQRVIVSKLQMVTRVLWYLVSQKLSVRSTVVSQLRYIVGSWTLDNSR
jgi:hypothetical protein